MVEPYLSVSLLPAFVFFTLLLATSGREPVARRLLFKAWPCIILHVRNELWPERPRACQAGQHDPHCRASEEGQWSCGLGALPPLHGVRAAGAIDTGFAAGRDASQWRGFAGLSFG